MKAQDSGFGGRVRMVESRTCVQREGVYRWFSSLTSAQRAEFLCGLLDLCVPIELRFLGSCLEDLARKEYHALRDAEIKANNPADLSGLTNITDEVVRSKLLVSLALLGSDNREAAGVLYRTLTHIDAVINNYGLALNDGRTEEQFLLLFTMASNHPAFSFHQKQVLRQQLGQIQDILQSQTREASTLSSLGSEVTAGRGDPSLAHELSSPPRLDPPPPPPPPPPPLPPTPHLPPPSPLPAGQSHDGPAPAKPHAGKTGKAVIERVVLRGATRKSEEAGKYVFEVSWSDGLVTSAVRGQQEVTELLSQLSQAFPEERSEKLLPPSTETDPRCLTALPCHVLQHRSVQLFFTSSRPLSPNCLSPLSASLPPLPSSPPAAPVPPTCPLTSSSASLGCMVQYRGANRAVYRVASVQPVVSTHSSAPTRSSHHLAPLPAPQLSALPPPGGGGEAAAPPQPHAPHNQLQPYPQPQHHLQPQHPPLSQSLSNPYSQSRSQCHAQPASQSQVSSQEQNGILDWLRRLRLHKYYPVFKQLTMEEFLALTEEDLNKYDLTQGAKKKLKTQLELQKSADREMKILEEKWSCSGIARVTPSAHMGPSTHTASAAELRVEVDTALHHHPVATDSSSSSGYSSSSCSPRTPLCCDSAFDRSRDLHRRGPDASGGGPDKDRSCVFILNSSSSRPTAQVLPVQTDVAPPPPLPPSCSSHLPFAPMLQSHYHPQGGYPQTLLSPVSNPARILASPRKPRPPPLCTDDRTKLLGSGVPPVGSGFGVGVRLESLFPGLSVDGHDAGGCRGVAAGAAVGPMVETSSALTSTSNSLHHVSHPPLHFHLSSSSSPTPSIYYSYPPSSTSTSSFSTFATSCSSAAKSASQTPSSSGGGGGGGGFAPMATENSVPVAAVPGNTFYPPQPTSSPSPASPLDQSSGHTSSVCVCSSCGCRGNCGAYGTLPGYTAAAGYLQPFSAGPSLFTLGPLLHLSPLIASSSAGGSGAAPFSYPMMVPPPLYSPVSHEQQKGFGFYQPHGIMGNGGHKQTMGNLSCYNCGANGHRAEDCKQPPMDSSQQGTYRLKYTPHADSKDSGD